MSNHIKRDKVIDWEYSGCYFPEPNLIENKVYRCKDENEGFGEFDAEFCFGDGEFWWLSKETGKEVRVTHFKRHKLVVKCDCHQCSEDEFMPRFIVCKVCGNKRCPKANDHRNECTNSNDTGQSGSAYE